MGCPTQIPNKCNHCGGDFLYTYVCSICPDCFLAGHRFSDCGGHCKETTASRAQVDALKLLMNRAQPKPAE